MRMMSELTLTTTTIAPDSTGKPIETPVPKTVFCEGKGVRRSEYYSAMAAGQQVDAVFEVNTDDYDGQTDVTFGGVSYHVSRTYPISRGRTELICKRM